MKGFIINLDAAVAVSFILFAMIIIASQSYNPRAPTGIYLKQLTLDTITVLEKTGRLEQALDGNSSALNEVVEATPKLACISLTVSDIKGNVMTTTTKSDCTDHSDLNIQVTARPIIYNGTSYVITSESWLRKEPN
ncbi:Uncharacterised protein [Candidatus Bilamarchaeum dharawalense]|uniref:Uncharacterized protein n=1 Tax=Candidatus Bilamarchaeum dharawalense TaxID=2885759 RepID=A0A5E4LLN8_9ARCH|nr:Uncharacterised protein [Candidatus Bilamarchaeum dharawalense]